MFCTTICTKLCTTIIFCTKYPYRMDGWHFMSLYCTSHHPFFTNTPTPPCPSLPGPLYPRQPTHFQLFLPLYSVLELQGCYRYPGKLQRKPQRRTHLSSSCHQPPGIFTYCQILYKDLHKILYNCLWNILYKYLQKCVKNRGSCACIKRQWKKPPSTHSTVTLFLAPLLTSQGAMVLNSW